MLIRKASYTVLPGSSSSKKLSKRELEDVITRAKKDDKTLKSIEIPNQKISNHLFNQFLDAIEVNQSLTRIDVSNNGLQDVGVCEVFNRLMISNNRLLRTIDVSLNGISLTTGKKISEYLSYHFHISSIKYNDTIGTTISEAGLTTDKLFDKKAFTDQITHKIESKLSSNRQMLRFLNSETNRFECWRRKVKSLGSVLREHWGERIVSLDLTGNEITQVPEMAQSFMLLEEFLFSHNRLPAFPDFMSQLLNLRVVDVSKNQIKKIPLGMRSLLHLETLIVSDNQITHLPLFLATLPKLTFLAVARNPIDTFPEDIVAESEQGGQKLIALLRARLHEYFDTSNDMDLPYKLSSEDENLISMLKEQQKSSPEDFSIFLPKKIVTHERKFVCRTLKPKCERKPTSIQKISDGIWCGMQDGSICHWDSRTFSLQEIKAKVLPAAILEILEIPAICEVWVAGYCNSLAVLPSRDHNSEFGSMEIFLDPQYSVVQCMIFVSLTNRVWVASGSSILSYCAQNKSLEGTITLDSPILSLLYHQGLIWAGCGDGCIQILKKSGGILKTINAASSMIFNLKSVGPYVWSSSNEEIIKVWIKPSTDDVHCIALIPVDGKELHLITASTHGETMYCQSGVAIEESSTFDVYEFSPTGRLLTVLETSHKKFITAMAWSRSPDRLWTADEDGVVCCHELKLGKKTIARLRNESTSPLINMANTNREQPNQEEEDTEAPVAVTGELKKAWRMSRVPTGETRRVTLTRSQLN